MPVSILLIEAQGEIQIYVTAPTDKKAAVTNEVAAVFLRIRRSYRFSLMKAVLSFAGRAKSSGKQCDKP